MAEQWSCRLIHNDGGFINGRSTADLLADVTFYSDVIFLRFHSFCLLLWKLFFLTQSASFDAWPYSLATSAADVTESVSLNFFETLISTMERCSRRYSTLLSSLGTDSHVVVLNSK